MGNMDDLSKDLRNCLCATIFIGMVIGAGITGLAVWLWH